MEENKKTNTAIVRFSSGRGNQMEIKFPEVRSNKQYIYYTEEGNFLGGNLNSDKVYISTKEKYDKAKNEGRWLYLNDDTKLIKNIDNKPIHHHLFIAFASLIWGESSTNKQEAFAIGNACVNFLKRGGSSSLKTLEDIALYRNYFAKGARQDTINTFCKESFYAKNDKYSVGAAINALIQDIKIPFITDYSYGADAWDGIDLVDSKTTNNHRTYRWTKNSKNLLLQYKNERNGGVDVSKFLYTDIKSDIKAIVILGKTIFCKILSGRGEKKIENKKFKIPF